ncbi:MAG: glycogen debranching protein [Hamadaea sp.]|uniref:amylo-alpha-1,6-glucosidase n=1 Tax=Hamadaea sp. TaxID=2024425 RepID=UPI001820C22B|nr:trehalase family glycosidase [Hamadaea sp.]NUT21350.1 glycogen debranching protein [Hamadaea sp.]
MTIASPTFTVQEIPFSYHGSWLDISPVIAKHTYADDLHLVSHQTGLHAVLRLVPTDGHRRVEAAVSANPARLGWVHQRGRVEAAFESADTIRVRGKGLGLILRSADAQLTPFSGIYLYRDPVAGAYVFTSYETGRRYRVTVLSGQVTVSGAEALGTAERELTFPADTPWEIAIEELDNARSPYSYARDFDDVAAAAAEAFTAFADAIAPWRGPGTPAAELAAYVLWSATVRPAGFLKRPAVLMSKHWMDKVWSWDHCFNAIALAAGVPELAWHQFRLPFDHQDPAGAIPDSVAHSEVLYNFVKPPVHGWALRLVRDRLGAELPREQLIEVYHELSAWTSFWLDARCAPAAELPHYQHGNDSGWDNATTFDADRVVETADLAAFLTLQLRTLAGLAGELGDHEAASDWARRASDLRDAMLRELWNGTEFVTRAVASGTTRTTASLLDQLPIVLGEDLPPPVAEALADRVKAHLTRYGLATELPQSDAYQPDGYWRGPIWAPATLLIEDGLRRAGFVELADEVSTRFRQLCESSGFAENFDALSGEGLRDRAYTWTASVYLILAADSARRVSDLRHAMLRLDD